MLLLAYAACCGRSTVEAEPAVSAAPMKRLSLEMDGSSAQHRRERVPLSAEEQQGEGDVDREIKVGAVFEGEAGPECSELVPGVFVDRAGPIRDVARRATAEAFGPFLSALAERCGFPVPSRSWSSGTALQGSGSGLVKRTLFAPRPLAGAPHLSRSGNAPGQWHRRGRLQNGCCHACQTVRHVAFSRWSGLSPGPSRTAVLTHECDQRWDLSRQEVT